MKRIFTLIGILACIVFSRVGYAQTITSVSYNDSCYGTGYTVKQAVITISGATASCTIESNFGDGSPLDTNVVFGGAPKYSTPTHYYYSAGVHTIKHVLICGGLRVDSIIQSISAACTYVQGIVYNDANGNCVLNTSEYLTIGTSSLEVDSAGVKIDTFTFNGWWGYKILATTPTTYKFKLLSPPTGYSVSCPANGVLTLSYTPSMISIPQQQFAVTCSSTAVYDYSLYFSRALRGASSGGASYINLHAYNNTCHAGTGTVTLHVSPKYNITGSGITPTPTSVIGNTVTWTIANLSYGSGGGLLHVPLSPKSTTNNGDTACNYAIITGASDVNVANNVINVCDSVRSSWDPNQKSVYPNGPVAAGTMLTYTIDFENLGNDTAFNIHVQDTLSPYLDGSTFSLQAATHRVAPTFYQMGGKNILRFDFVGINLEDKNVPTRNKGQVQFTIKVKNGTPIGTVIPNRAGIYFDGNPAVITNYTYSTIPVPGGVAGVGKADDIKVFPNPAANVLNIQVGSSNWDEAVLCNALGQVVARQVLNRGNNVVDIEALPTGVYHLQVKGSAGTTSEKIEKQ
jgi:uncharacterized repeat protein (TIGR01451 family)